MHTENALGVRGTMNRKPVLFRDAKTVLALKEDSAFREKKLCDGPVLNLGDTCAYSCQFCYVDAVVAKFTKETLESQRPDSRLGYRDVVVRRRNSVQLLRDQLIGKQGPRFSDPDDRRVVFASSLVDVAANMDLLKETAVALTVIFANTAWDVRLLSKSNLLHRLIADRLIPEEYHRRIIFGVSTGTLDERVAKAIETGTPNMSKRLESLHWLQDRGFRTYGMVCPSLPQGDPVRFSREAYAAIRGEQCEHIWAEVINVRGSSMTRTLQALRVAQLDDEAERLEAVTGAGHESAWEKYARETFLGHTACVPPSKLRFLQYVSESTQPWWLDRVRLGAVLLGEASASGESPPSTMKSVLEIKPPVRVVRDLAQEAKDAVDRDRLKPVSSDEEKRLTVLENTVSKAVKASLSAARALHEIHSFKEGIFWKRSYESFEEYCGAKWGYRKAHSYRLLGAGDFVARAAVANGPSGFVTTSKLGRSWYPQNEAQVRPVLRLPVEFQVNAWNEIVEKKPVTDLTGPEVTRAVNQFAKREKIAFPKRKRSQLSLKQRAEKALGAFVRVAAMLPNADQIEKKAKLISKLI